MLADYHQGRQYLAATSAAGRALFAGGYTTYGSNSNAVDIYDSASDTWSVSALSATRGSKTSHLCAASVGTKAMFAGGTDSNGNPTSLVDIYDAVTGTWATASLSQARYSLAAVTVGSRVIFAGGTKSNQHIYSDMVDIYNDQTGTWSTATLSQARSELAGATLGTMAIFAGGNAYSGIHYSDVVDIYDTATDTWSTTTLSEARRFICGTAVAGQAMFAGGETGTDPYSDRVDIYIPEPATLSLLALSGLAVIRRRR